MKDGTRQTSRPCSLDGKGYRKADKVCYSDRTQHTVVSRMHVEAKVLQSKDLWRQPSAGRETA